jgi:hypothetical protein
MSSSVIYRAKVLLYAEICQFFFFFSNYDIALMQSSFAKKINQEVDDLKKIIESVQSYTCYVKRL